MTKDVSESKDVQRRPVSRHCAVEEAACDRTKVPATAQPPSTVVDGKHTAATTGGEFSEGMNKRLTFEFSGRRRRSAGMKGWASWVGTSELPWKTGRLENRRVVG